MADFTLSFNEIAPGVGVGTPAPGGWQPIHQRPLLILVGLTGVGKSTTLAYLMDGEPGWALLPDRRTLTDRLIIAAMQAAAGEPVEPVRDRIRRFQYTRRYRELYPGGMAHALAQLWIDPGQLPGPLLFDGLRGDNEVAFAAGALPQAHFAMLDAPDVIRVQRLLGRNDAFDQVHLEGGNVDSTATTRLADLGIQGAEALFTPGEAERLLRLVHSGAVPLDELRARVKIVAEERQNYDPDATRAALLREAGSRSLVIDTVAHGPAEVARQILAWFPCTPAQQPASPA
ncbi:hypothetical protein FKZ61_002095 [Litorilinea aerophila]|uniref:hypothetical protein n=1 Tax=Litorilinea aerophila TaxID=1204385 RepID=UPI001B886622|nr:hypothetical protein [Litorilinea aerophila]MCC9074907.1 hypothetical protein [Litorilinea aerophila]